MDTIFPASSPPWAILDGLSHVKDIPCRSSILVKFWSDELPTLADLNLKFEVEVLKNTLFKIYLRHENLSSQKIFLISSIEKCKFYIFLYWIKRVNQGSIEKSLPGHNYSYLTPKRKFCLWQSGRERRGKAANTLVKTRHHCITSFRLDNIKSSSITWIHEEKHFL